MTDRDEKILIDTLQQIKLARETLDFVNGFRKNKYIEEVKGSLVKAWCNTYAILNPEEEYTI